MGIWGSFLIPAAALKTPTRNSYYAQGVNLTFCVLFLQMKLGEGDVQLISSSELRVLPPKASR